MRKFLVILLSASMFFLVGCNPVVDPESEIESSASEEEATDGGNTLYSELAKEKFAALTEGSYKELEIDAFVKAKNATLPGQVVSVTVIIKNSGDQTIIYPVGSSANTVPDALLVVADGLQTVPAESSLGAVTMDMSYGTLEPGESKEFTVNIMAIKENAKFIEHVLEYYMETQKYFVGIDTTEFLEKYTDLEKVEAGTFNTKVYFEYKIAEGDEKIITTEDTSYNTFSFDLAIS